MDAPPTLPAPLVLQAPNGGVRLLPPGEPSRLLAPDGRWPAWDPSGTRIAVSFLDWRTSQPASRLAVLNREGRHLATPYVSPQGVAPVIAPGVPHYVYWSPVGEELAVVAPSANGLALFFAPSEGGEGKPAVVGAPIFPAWSPDGRWLLVHYEGNLELFDRAAATRRTVASGNAVGFRTPDFSSDGALMAYAVVREGRTEVWCAPPADRGAAELVARFEAGIAFSFVPATRAIAVAVAQGGEATIFDRLVLIDEGGEQRLLHRGPFHACFPSPDGARLLLVVPEQAADRRLKAYVRRFPDGAIEAVSDWFIPSAPMSVVLSFFDQFQRSHRLWSPDGSLVVLCGYRLGEGPSPVFGDGRPRVLFWDGSRRSEWCAGDPAELAFFAPAIPL